MIFNQLKTVPSKSWNTTLRQLYCLYCSFMNDLWFVKNWNNTKPSLKQLTCFCSNVANSFKKPPFPEQVSSNFKNNPAENKFHVSVAPIQQTQ